MMTQITKPQAEALRVTKAVVLVGLFGSLLGVVLAQASWLQGKEALRQYAPLLSALCIVVWGASGWIGVRAEIRRKTAGDN